MRDAESRFAVSAERAGTSRFAPGGSPVALASLAASDGSSAPASRRLPLRRSLISALLVLGALLVLTAPAGAAEHVTITGEYGKEGPKATGLGNGCSIAWHSATNRLFLLSESKVYGLNKTAPGSVTPVGGTFPFPTQNSSCGDRDLAVDNSGTGTNGRIYMVPSSSEIYGYTSTGSVLGAPWPVSLEGETCGVAVDNAGNVWGGRYSSPPSAKRFSSAGALQQTVSVPGQICKVAINPANNDLFTAEYSSPNTLRKWTAASGYTTSVNFPSTGTNNPGLAVNGNENRIYVAGGTTVKAYDTNSGALVETITPPAGGVRDVAVDESTDTLFVSIGSGASGYIVEYLGVKVPKAITGEPTGNTEVSGTADPNEVGPITECYFEWGLTTGYGKKTNCTEAVPFNEVKTVHAVLPPGEMIGEETYHYRLVLDTGKPNVIGKGGDKTIIPHYVKSVTTKPATEVTRTSARLNATFEGNGEATTYFFEYGLSACPCGTRMPLSPTEESAGSPSAPTIGNMTVAISGLTPEKTYHFRVVAKNPQGTSPGKDVTFVTPDAVQNVVTEDATDQTRDTANLHGSFTGNGELHTYEFEWGPTTSYGQKVGGSAGNGVGKVDVESPIEGLDVYLPNSLPYHYRLLVTNSTGTKVGPDHTFFPAPPGLPVIEDLGAENVSPTGAKLTGLVNPEEGPTSVVFEYGPTSSYGSVTTPTESIGDDVTDHPVSETIAELTPGTTYHFRLVASNFGGSTHSEDMTFFTPAAPRIELSGSSAIGTASAHLTSLVVPNGSPTGVRFEYGTSGAYGSSTAQQAIGEGLNLVESSADLSGLQPSTTYHFRAVAENGVGATYGVDQTFTTGAAPALVSTAAPKSCRKGFVKRNGKCVRKKKKHRKHSKRGSHRNG